MNAHGMEVAASLHEVSKVFGSARVLRDVSIEFGAGEVHALIGENGAGKSSVGKVLGGYYSADGGVIEVFGQQVQDWNPWRALHSGVAMMHQELQLIPELTVAQNVFLGVETNRLGVLTGSDTRRFRKLDEFCQFGLDPSLKVADLSIADRQKVEIMRAIAREARIIIMDEPTSSLTEVEAIHLHDTIRRLKAHGTTTIYITHFLDHVRDVADRVTIMRDGQVIKTSRVCDETKQSLVEAMLGQSVDVAYPTPPPAPPPDAAPRLAVKGLSTQTGVSDVSLTIRAGEIVGLFGLVGSGRSEIARAIFGADPSSAGEVWLNGSSYGDRNPRRSVERKLAFVPEDRRAHGLVMTLPVRSNMSLAHIAKIARAGIIDRKQEDARTRQMIESFNIQPGLVDGRVVHYSGGNQQKVLLAKWVYERPDVIMLDEPSRGVDIGARRRIHDFIVELAASGVAVLLVSSDLDELLELVHRGYLISRGSVIGTVEPEGSTVESILKRLFAVEAPPAMTVAH